MQSNIFVTERECSFIWLNITMPELRTKIKPTGLFDQSSVLA